MKYRKKPVIIEAVKYDKTRAADLLDFVPQDMVRYNQDDNEYYVKSLDGWIKCVDGHYIVLGGGGRYLLCEPEVFEERYDLLEDEISASTALY